MISQHMKELNAGNSLIRAMFEEGKRLTALHGAENVFDFSLGNPSVSPPNAVKQAVLEIMQDPTHGYMNNSGYPHVRESIAQSINRLHNTAFSDQNIVMTVGAAGALNIVLKSILDPGDEVIVFAPFFGEYRHYVNNFNGKLVVAATNKETFQPEISALEAALSERTKAVIINSPNNPSGVIYPESTIQALTDLLRQQKQTIYLISDEPYRELVYDNNTVPYITHYYPHSFVAYSFSKALSLPGERIGYLAVPSEMDSFEDVINALNVANRIMGYVNAPSLFQLVAERCVDAKVELDEYEKNRNVLYEHLLALGFSVTKPQGAFYMFPRSLIADDVAFCEKAKEYNLLLVPGSAFGSPGFFRLAFCVGHESVQRSLLYFEKLARSF